MSAIWLVARAELRRRWIALVVIGLLAGITGAVVTGTTSAARRTGTAYDRLIARSGVGDANVVTMTDDPSIPDRLLALEGVTGGWIAGFSVALPEGDEVTYMGILSGPPRPPGVYDPPLVAGRRPDPGNPFEVTMIERLAVPFGIEPGHTVPMRFLTAAEVGQFDTGFGEPDGPAIELVITGIARSPILADAIAPLTGTPAFHEQFGPETSAAAVVFVDLEEGETGIPQFERHLDELREVVSTPEGFEEFATMEPSYTRTGATTFDTTSSVLVSGLSVFAGVAALAGLATLVLALGRHHDGTAERQAVERALGLTLGQRVAARLLPASLAAAVAAACTAAGGLAAGAIEPLGGLNLIEPSPGWAPNLALVAAAAAMAAAVVLIVAGLTAARAGRPRATVPPRVSRLAERVGALGGSAVPVVGMRFALEASRSRRAAPVRSAIGGAAVGVLGVLAVGIFTTSLDRLVDDPARWGGIPDFTISDVRSAGIQETSADPRLDSLVVSYNNNVVIEGRQTASYAHEPVRGDIPWTVVDGRVPSADDDIMLGTRIARRLHRGVGDTVTIRTRDGAATYEVVGVGIGPASSGEVLGEAALFTPDGLEAAALAASFDELLVTVSEGEDALAVAREYAQRYEVSPRERPVDIEDLRRLGLLPEALGLFLLVLGAAALVNGLVAGVRRRGGTIAVLRVMGLTPRQVARVIFVMATTTAAVALLVGLPLGVAIARVVWRAVAEGAGVAPDPITPAWLAVIVPATLLVSLAIAVLPARRAALARPTTLLHAE